MPDAKIEVKVGAVSFTGEGTESWLSAELDKFIKHLPDLVMVAPLSPPPGDDADDPGKEGTSGKKSTLAAFLTAKNAKSNQTRKFLATALWLHDSGKKRLSTSDVSKALSDYSQGSLTNPSQCLVNNVTQGFCDKDGRQFYVTDEGRTEIG